MIMKKILFISCLNTKKEKFDGERIKNTFIYNSLSKFADLTLINLSHNKILNSLKIFFKGLFDRKKYDYIVISKDSHGANIIQKILIYSRFPSNKIVYFEIGPFLYDRILNGSIKKETFINDRLIIVETQSMKEELKSVGFERISVFPNFKPIVTIDFRPHKYPKDVLHLVYLSRIEEQKGIYDLIDCLTLLNKDRLRFKLDVYGRPQREEEKTRIEALAAKHHFVNFLGAIAVDTKEAYEKLSEYDLHVFPTKYREGFPGSIIDFFIAGVPTISSTFARAHEILSQEDSILFQQADNNDLLTKLNYIYDNQDKLNSMREKSFAKKDDYSIEKFEQFLQNLLGRGFHD